VLVLCHDRFPSLFPSPYLPYCLVCFIIISLCTYILVDGVQELGGALPVASLH
jgi:hypothetical protein